VPEIAANTVLPARRESAFIVAGDGVRLAAEWSLPVDRAATSVIVMAHPLPTAGGSMDSHLIRKAAWRLPALAGIGVLRFNMRGTTSAGGTSEGFFEANMGEGLDLVAAVGASVERGFPRPWLVGWSFGTDVILRWGNVDPVVGAVLLSPPGRWSTPGDVASWTASGRPIAALVPEHDEFAPPSAVQARFSGVPQAEVTGVAGAKHLWVGERYARIALNAIVAKVLPAAAPLPTAWDGPMERWSDPVNQRES
jgi:uncharacterized protein